MPDTVTISNDGPEIVETTYWQTDLAHAGTCYLSPHAGCFRLLLPPQQVGAVRAIRMALRCVVSRGPYPARHWSDALELLCEDGHTAPFRLPVSPEALDRMPPELRAQVLRSFGIGEADLDSPAVGDAIVKRLADRGAALGLTAQQKGKPDGKGISLDKAWHGLHFLLCGAAEPAPGPLGQAVLGGTEIGEDLGYGPARYFTAAQTSEIAQALQAPGLEAVLRARFNPAGMTSLGLYPGGWDVNGVDWLIEAFHTVRDFYAAAATSGQAVVTVIE